MTHHSPADSNTGPRPGRRSVILSALGLATTAACTGTTEPPPPSGSTGSPSPHTTPGGPAPSTTPSSIEPPPSGAPVPTGLGDPGPDIANGPRDSALVALTFHGSGDLTLTAQVLAIARMHGASITVFAVGQWLAANPAIGRAITAAGHDLGNHTWSHPSLATLSLPAATGEIQKGADAVSQSIGSPGLLFRPSGTQTSTSIIRAAAAAAGYARCISYDVDSLDYTDPGATAVRARTLGAIVAGSIVSLHLGHAGTVEALPGILDGIASRHLQAVTLTRMLMPST